MDAESKSPKPVTKSKSNVTDSLSNAEIDNDKVVGKVCPRYMQPTISSLAREKVEADFEKFYTFKTRENYQVRVNPSTLKMKNMHLSLRRTSYKSDQSDSSDLKRASSNPVAESGPELTSPKYKSNIKPTTWDRSGKYKTQVAFMSTIGAKSNMSSSSEEVVQNNKRSSKARTLNRTRNLLPLSGKLCSDEPKQIANSEKEVKSKKKIEARNLSIGRFDITRKDPKFKAVRLKEKDDILLSKYMMIQRGSKTVKDIKKSGSKFRDSPKLDEESRRKMHFQARPERRNKLVNKDKTQQLDSPVRNTSRVREHKLLSRKSLDSKSESKIKSAILNTVKVAKSLTETDKKTKIVMKSLISSPKPEKSVKVCPASPTLTVTQKHSDFPLEENFEGSLGDTSNIRLEEVKNLSIFNWTDIPTVDPELTEKYDKEKALDDALIESHDSYPSGSPDEENCSSEFFPQIKNDEDVELKESVLSSLPIEGSKSWATFQEKEASSEYKAKSLEDVHASRHKIKSTRDTLRSVGDTYTPSCPSPDSSGKMKACSIGIGEKSGSRLTAGLTSTKSCDIESSLEESSASTMDIELLLHGRPRKQKFKTKASKEARKTANVKKTTPLPRVASCAKKTATSQPLPPTNKGIKASKDMRILVPKPKPLANKSIKASRDVKILVPPANPLTNKSIKASSDVGILVPKRTKSVLQFMRTITMAGKKKSSVNTLKSLAFGSSILRPGKNPLRSVISKKKKTVKKKKKRTMKPYGQKSRVNDKVDCFKSQFRQFAKFGDRRNSGETISMTNTVRWLKQAGIVGKRGITPNDIEIYFIYTIQRRRSLKILEFLQFLRTLCSEKALSISAVVMKLMECGPPAVSVTDITIKSILSSETQDQVLPNIFAQPLPPTVPAKLAEVPYISSATARQLRRDIKASQRGTSIGNNRYEIPFPIPQVYFQSSGEALPLQCISYDVQNFVHREPIFMVRSSQTPPQPMPQPIVKANVDQPGIKVKKSLNLRKKAKDTTSSRRYSSSSEDEQKKDSPANNKTPNHPQRDSVRRSMTRSIVKTRSYHSGTLDRRVESSGPATKAKNDGLVSPRSWHGFLPTSSRPHEDIALRPVLGKNQMLEWKLVKGLESVSTQGVLPADPHHKQPLEKGKKRRQKKKRNHCVETLIESICASSQSESTE